MTILNGPVLVLNKSWVPINFITVRRALSKVLNDRARIIDPDDYSVNDFASWVVKRDNSENIATETLQIKIPEVIVLTKYNKIPKTRVRFSKKSIFRRDIGVCQYCKIVLDNNWELEHVVPRAQGGQTKWTNCVAACTDCNQRKKNRTPEQAGMQLLRQPFKPQWDPSIRIDPRNLKHSWTVFCPDNMWML